MPHPKCVGPAHPGEDDGEARRDCCATKISRTVFADHVMALRAPPKERKPKAAKEATTSHEPATSRRQARRRSTTTFRS